MAGLRLRSEVVLVLVLRMLGCLRHGILSMRAKVLRRRARYCLRLADLVKGCAWVCALLLHVVAILCGVGANVEIDVAEFEQVSEVVEVIADLRHWVEGVRL